MMFIIVMHPGLPKLLAKECEKMRSDCFFSCTSEAACKEASNARYSAAQVEDEVRWRRWWCVVEIWSHHDKD